MGQIWSPTCFCMAQELRMVCTFIKGWKITFVFPLTFLQPLSLSQQYFPNHNQHPLLPHFLCEFLHLSYKSIYYLFSGRTSLLCLPFPWVFQNRLRKAWELSVGSPKLSILSPETFAATSVPGFTCSLNAVSLPVPHIFFKCCVISSRKTSLHLEIAKDSYLSPPPETICIVYISLVISLL